MAYVLIHCDCFYIEGLAEAFPESGLQIGLWLDGYKGCRKIVSGVLDENIYWLFDFIQLRLPKQIPKVFLRVGYEFDNPSFGYSDDPEAYKEAFRHIVRVCESRMTPNICHDKIVFVWHSWAAPRKPDVSLEQFYPGDSYVDWVGISIFQQLYPWANDENWIYKESDFAGGNIIAVKEVLEYAKSRGKQTMIAESTPFGGFNVTKSSIAKKYIQDDTINNDIWNLWFQKTIDLIDEYDISMWSYINCDWDNQPMWKYAGFGNTLLSSSEVVMSQWWDRILANNSRFLLRLGKCDESPLPIGSKIIQAQKLSPTQQELTRNSALATILNLNNDHQDSFITPNNGFLYLICAGSVMMMILIGTKIFQGNRNQKAETPLTTPSLSLSGSNRLSEYGSLDE